MYLSLLFFSLILKCSLTISDHSPSVIIIGAGPAGIAAATKLLENSITNIKILEAEDRIGGRINSVQIGNDYVELGAQFCHGKDGNIVYDLAKDILNDNSEQIIYSIFYSNGSVLDSNFSEDIIDAISTYYDFEDKNSEINKTGVSVGELYTNRYKLSVLKKYANNPKNLKAAKEAILLAEQLILLSEGSFSWFEPSALSHFEECPGNPVMFWKKEHGYRIILDILMKKFPDPKKQLPIDDKIFLNTIVTEINYSDEKNNTKVITKSVIYTADHVIFTPSIGVLKHNHKKLFQPQLPTEKQKAITGIGFDGIMKIIAHFPNQWWKETDKAFTFLWSEEDMKKTAEEFILGPSKDGVSWVTSIPSIVQVSAPNVLMAWVSGEMVPEIEKLSDDALKAGFLYVLDKFLGKIYNITEPDKMLKTNWCSNLNFLGTYSFDDVKYYNDSINYHEELARPLVDENGRVRLQFAGEATSFVHYSTVHGAIESGHREAQRIIDLYK